MGEVPIPKKSQLRDCNTELEALEDEFVKDVELEDSTMNDERALETEVMKDADQEYGIVEVGCVDLSRDDVSSSDTEMDQEFDENIAVGDSAEFSKSRMEMKRLRYARRNQIENCPKAAEVEGN